MTTKAFNYWPLTKDRYTSEDFFNRVYAYINDAKTGIDDARNTISALDVLPQAFEDPNFEDIDNAIDDIIDDIGDITAPNVPSLHGIPSGNTPDKPELVSGTLAKTATISALVDTLNSTLIARLTQATAMDPDIELAIWDRARDREVLAGQMTVRAILVDGASRGFSRPTGARLTAIDKATQDAQAAISNANREIFIQQSQLEQDNIKFTLTQLQAFEAQLLQAKLAYENNAVKLYEVDWQGYINNINIIVAMNKAIVDLYTQQIEKYKADASLEGTKADILIKALQALNEKNNFLAQFAIEKIKYFSNFDMSKFETKVKAWEAIGQIQGQLCATAMNSMNVSNSFSYGIHHSGTESHSYSGE